MSMSGPGESPDAGFLGRLRAVAMIAVVAGAVGSLGLMLRAGRGTPRLLLFLFVIWVFSPFAAVVLADRVSKRWSVVTRAALYSVTLVLTLGSLAVYGDIVPRPPGTRPAFVFLVVPLASWLLMAIVVPIAALMSGRLSRRGAGA